MTCITCFFNGVLLRLCALQLKLGDWRVSLLWLIAGAGGSKWVNWHLRSVLTTAFLDVQIWILRYYITFVELLFYITVRCWPDSGWRLLKGWHFKAIALWLEILDWRFGKTRQTLYALINPSSIKAIFADPSHAFNHWNLSILCCLSPSTYYFEPCSANVRPSLQ
jgi:hypothetical protein